MYQSVLSFEHHFFSFFFKHLCLSLLALNLVNFHLVSRFLAISLDALKSNTLIRLEHIECHGPNASQIASKGAFFMHTFFSVLVKFFPNWSRVSWGKFLTSPFSNTDEKKKEKKNGYCKAFCVTCKHNNLETDLKCRPQTKKSFHSRFT